MVRLRGVHSISFFRQFSIALEVLLPKIFVLGLHSAIGFLFQLIENFQRLFSGDVINLQPL